MKWQGRRMSKNIEDRRVKVAADTIVGQVLSFVDKALDEASATLSGIIKARTPPVKAPRLTIAGGR